MDKAATFTFWKGDKTVRYVNGIVTGFGLGKSGFVRTSYQMVVEPALVRAELQSVKTNTKNEKLGLML